MMFLPIGDDVDSRSLPIAGSLLIAACLIVSAWQFRVLADMPKNTSPKQYVAAVEKQFKTWGLVPQDVARGRLVGLVTYQFVHAGPGHLIGNLIILWALVHSLESHLGAARFFGLYLLWGIAGGLAHVAMNWGDTMPMVGASGAIAGMIGAYFVAYGGLTRIRTLYWFFGPRTLYIPSAVYILVWFLSQVAGADEAARGTPGVAWYCHIGGFIAGMATMYPIRNSTAKQLCVGQDGKLFFERADDDESNVDDDSYVATTNCPYCDRPIDPDLDANAKLVRCLNPVCGRVIFLDPVETSA